jgi:hypothetical protein
LHELGRLSADGRRNKDLLFHPFRIYVFDKALSEGERFAAERARELNGIVDLAILLEPLFWPSIVGHRREAVGAKDLKTQRTKYRSKALKLVKTLDPVVWRKFHENLRIDAAWMDRNSELYVLLRLSSWEQREKLEGKLSCALWIRHMAEVIRLAFEEAHQTQWVEEDEAFGYWPQGSRIRAFGSERPFNDPLRSKPFIAYRFGLFTGSALRWYVEGETEYYAVLHTLGDPSRLGIELVNLRGEIAKDKGSAARKLGDALREDLALRRFSVISFDRDEEANERAIRGAVEREHVVGSINANDPDFEFANFSLDELVEIAALTARVRTPIFFDV